MIPCAPFACISVRRFGILALPLLSALMARRSTRSSAMPEWRLTHCVWLFAQKSGSAMHEAGVGLERYRRLFGPRRHRGELDRDSLPAPEAYLRERGLLTQRVRGEWASVRCPVHKNGDEVHPSLRISLRDGHFHCHACGASGGDVLALHRILTGLGFREAVRDLGARFHA